jgi:hypothetical protein
MRDDRAGHKLSLQKNNHAGNEDYDTHKQQAQGTGLAIPVTWVVRQYLMDYRRRVNTQQQDPHQL